MTSVANLAVNLYIIVNCMKCDWQLRAVGNYDCFMKFYKNILARRKEMAAKFNIRQILCLWRLWKRIRIRQSKQKLRYLKKPSICRRDEMGEFQLVKELYFDDHETFFKYFRMSHNNAMTYRGSMAYSTAMPTNFHIMTSAPDHPFARF